MRVVCVNVGAKFTDDYVNRMYLMCRRYVPFMSRFTCFTDRPRNLNAEIEQYDCSSWGLTGWWPKLRLFDRAVLDEEFLFLDLDQILLKSMEPIYLYSQSNPEPRIIGMVDFHYRSFSSNILWVRPSDATQGIWDAYTEGERFVAEGRSSGDQDFIAGYAHSRGMAHLLATFPPEWFASYKLLRKWAHDRAKVAQLLDSSLFLVFHGRPMPHEVLQSVKSLLYLLHHRPLRAFRYWRFLEGEVRSWWCLEEGAQGQC